MCGYNYNSVSTNISDLVKTLKSVKLSHSIFLMKVNIVSSAIKIYKHWLFYKCCHEETVDFGFSCLGPLVNLFSKILKLHCTWIFSS